jgi:hypothetical protein
MTPMEQQDLIEISAAQAKKIGELTSALEYAEHSIGKLIAEKAAAEQRVAEMSALATFMGYHKKSASMKESAQPPAAAPALTEGWKHTAEGA